MKTELTDEQKAYVKGLRDMPSLPVWEERKTSLDRFLDHIPDALAMPLIMLVAALVGGLDLSCGGGR